jgi:class 3 adenylate cyclase/tetratricopeptide (TPR) repeat protein
MNCPKCRFENPEGFHFCGKCGFQLSILPDLPGQEQSLDTKLERIQRYLPRELVEKILSQRNEIEGERRQVTIMFCDIKESTPLVDKLGPEKAFSFLNQILEILIYKTHEYEGTVNELRGDGVLALFGAPYAIENAPQRALQSAIAIHREIKRFNEKNDYHSGIPLISLRIGINTGPVVVGSVGNDLRIKFTAVGDTINMAARMEQMAEPGTTYIAEETFRLTKSLFNFKALGKKTVKGKKTPLAVYEVLSGKKDADHSHSESERMLRSEMLGRENELNQLILQISKAINGTGSVINIIGEAGIGKSRLIAELKKLDIIDQVSFLEGRAISIGRKLSYYPVINFLKQWAHIKTDDGEATALSKLEFAVESVCSEDLPEVLPFVATLMGMNLTGTYAERVTGIEGESLEKLILINVRMLLVKASKVIPLVIVAEDLHWADTSSIELMGSLYRLAKTQKIVFINVFRPIDIKTGHRIAEIIREKLPDDYIEIALTPLNEMVCRSFITRLLTLSYRLQNVIDQIIRRAGGNPFFIKEVVWSLIDEGAVVLKEGVFLPTDKIDAVHIPHTLMDVLMARIDRLDVETQNLLRSASVIGQEFLYRILLEATSRVEDIDDRLSYLKVIELIKERKGVGELKYLFNHALVQEVAYDSILPIRKKELHRKVAASIEKVFGDQLNNFYGMLAYHYGKADSPEKTEKYLIKAGEEALKSSASSEALHYYQEALSLYQKNYGDVSDPEKIAVLEKNIALALYNKGQHIGTVEHFDKALKHYWGASPKNWIPMGFKLSSGFFHFLISLYLPLFKFKKTPKQIDNESIDLFFKKLKVLAITNPKKYFIESMYFYRKLTRFDLTKCELGIGMFAGASNLFSFTGISFGLSRKIIGLLKNRVDKNDIKSFIIYDFSDTLHKYMEGGWKNIRAYDDDLVSKNLNIGEIYWTSQHYYWHALPKLYQGDLDVARLLVEKLAGLFDVYENNLSLSLKYLLNTSLLLERHQIHSALMEIDEGLEFGRQRIEGPIQIEMYSRKAHIHILMGEIEFAERYLNLANEVRGEIDTVPWQLTDFLRGQFECDLYRLKESIKTKRKDEISQHRKKANKSSKQFIKATQKVAQFRTDSYKLRGTYFWLINRQKKAISWWQRAIEEGERLGARLELSRSYFEVGKCLSEDKSKYKTLNGIKAEAYLEKARGLFEEMDLQWDLDQLDQVSKI